MYTYQKTNTFFAQHAGGMGDAAADELRELGVGEVNPSVRGVFFQADSAGLYRVNYRSQILSRILAPLIVFDCHSKKYLYKTAMKIEWSDFMSVNTTFAIYATVSDSNINHSQYAALLLKDAIADYFRDRFAMRPDVDTNNPDIVFNLRIHKNRATISLDTSGGSLHRRGYRAEAVEAPMQETLAATIIRHSEWDGSRPLYDPMCGSGTLLGEALIRYCRIPTGLSRKRFGFENMPDFDPEIWDDVKKESDKRMRKLPPDLISGSDLSPQAVKAARKNLCNLPGGKEVNVYKKDYNAISSLENTTIVCNPPYGIRCGKKKDMESLYYSLGEFLKHKCKGADAYIYFGDPELMNHMKIKRSWRRRLKNGGLDGVMAKFVLY